MIGHELTRIERFHELVSVSKLRHSLGVAKIRNFYPFEPRQDQLLCQPEFGSGRNESLFMLQPIAHTDIAEYHFRGVFQTHTVSFLAVLVLSVVPPKADQSSVVNNLLHSFGLLTSKLPTFVAAVCFTEPSKRNVDQAVLLPWLILQILLLP